MIKAKDIYDYLCTLAPLDTQEEWDNSGFLIGDMEKEVETVVLSLDATNAVVDFSVGMGADMMLTHHPVIFNEMKNVIKGSVVYELCQSGIAAVSLHTPFDKAQGGMNDRLAALLNLTSTYHHKNGFLTIGELENEMSIDDFAMLVSDMLTCEGLRYTDTESIIKKVAICTGAGEEFLNDAMECADCLLTGDGRYHTMLEASECDFAMISAGHYETEYAVFCSLKADLEKAFPSVTFIIAPQKNPVLAVQ